MPEQLWDWVGMSERLSWLPSALLLVRSQSRSHDQSKPIQRRLSCVILSMGAALFGQGQSFTFLQQNFFLLLPAFGQGEATGRLHSNNFLELDGTVPFLPVSVQSVTGRDVGGRSRGSGLGGPVLR